MNPNHNSLTPSCPTKSQRLSPELTLISSDSLNLLLLLLLTTLHILEVSRNPLLLTTLVHKLGAVLLERRHGVQRELTVRGNKLRRAGNDHCRDGLVGLEEVLN